VVDNLSDPDAVLVFDETGQEKSGIMTAGVGRQYTGTAGKITNAIDAVYCTYATSRGHCLIDGDLYVQKAYGAPVRAGAIRLAVPHAVAAPRAGPQQPTPIPMATPQSRPYRLGGAWSR
jgi:hypothetical protein